MNKTFVTILVLVVVVVGGYFILKSPKVQAPSQETAVTPNTTTPTVGNSEDYTPPANPPTQTSHLVTYTNAGFSPSSLTIKAGETVTWKNDSAQNMWVASAMHPTHMLYSGTTLSAHCPDLAGTAFDACKAAVPGSSWSFTFQKVGTWAYHDHLHSSLFGKIVVE